MRVAQGTLIDFGHRSGSGPLRGAQAVAKALALLRMFDDRAPIWGASEMARMTHLHRATVHRLLTALERAGMLARDGKDRFRLGPEAIALGARAVRTSDLRGIARPELELLAETTHETATLEVLVGADMLILDEVLAPGVLTAKPSVGTRWPAHATSTGKAVLALMSPANREQVLGKRLDRFTSETIVTHNGLTRASAEIRRAGYAIAWHELENGYVAIGAAIRDRDGRAVGALSVGGPSVRMGGPRAVTIGAKVRAAAARVSASLGHPAAA